MFVYIYIYIYMLFIKTKTHRHTDTQTQTHTHTHTHKHTHRQNDTKSLLPFGSLLVSKGRLSEGKEGFNAHNHFRARSAIIPDPSISQALKSSAAAACVGRTPSFIKFSHRLITCRTVKKEEKDGDMDEDEHEMRVRLKRKSEMKTRKR